MADRYECLDGNEAAARIAYAAQRGHLDLPDHPGLADGGALRRLVRRRATEPLGQRPRCRRDAVGGGRGRGPARRAPEGRPGDDVHRLAGPPADDPEHVQDRRRADPGRHPRRRPHGRDPRPVDLRRPQRCDARPHDRLGDARGRLGPGGTRLRARRPCGDAPGPACPSSTSSMASGRRTRSTRSPLLERGRHPGARPRRGRPRLPRPGHDARRARRPRHRAEPGCLLPGPRGVEPVPPRGAGDRPGGHG